MPSSEQTRPERLIAVHRADLVTMARWKCIRTAANGGPCQPEKIREGDCCRACWASHFAEKALRESSTKLPKTEELKALDVWDLLKCFGDTVRQIGGEFIYDFVAGKAYLRPPNFTGTTLIPIHVVKSIPGEADVRAEADDGDAGDKC